MRVHRFETATVLRVPRERVFPFFADAANLERITPPELRFRIVTPLPIEMREGALITYRLRLFGIPFAWHTRITTWDPPHAFVDEQIRGPYRQWIHRHTFEASAEGTVMRDTVDYGLPLYPFGEISAPIVAWQVARIFKYRASVIAGLFRRSR